MLQLRGAVWTVLFAHHTPPAFEATPLIPVARPDTGFEIANAAILKALRDAGHDVTAIGFLRPGEVPADPDQAVVVAEADIENAVVPAGEKLRWLAAAMRLGMPVACAKLRLI